MSADSTDSERSPSDERPRSRSRSRSRSILRQVRATLTGRSMTRQCSEEPLSRSSVTFRPNSSQVRPRPKATPVSFSHRLSLLSQMKSHWIGQKKYRQTAPSTWTDEEDHLIAPAKFHSESKSSSMVEGHSHSNGNGIDAPSIEPLVNLTAPAEIETTMFNSDSLEMAIEDDGQQPLIGEASRSSSYSRMSLNKFKDQFTQRARTVLTKSPSLTSILTNSSAPVTPLEHVYWTEVCIERGKDLAVKDLNGTSDPYVKVLYGNEEKYTTAVISKNLNPIWNERFTFFTEDLTIPLCFELFDRDLIGRDEPMGSTKIDLSKIPFDSPYQATLELENEGRNDGKLGTLKVSITLSPKSPQFRDEVLRSLARQASSKTSVNGRSGAMNGVITTRRTIDVFIIEGRNLLTVGTNKTCSPYVKLKFASNKKYRTQTIKGTSSPKWHQSFMYDTTLTDLPPLELTVLDDTNGSGDFLGRGMCNLAHLEEERTHRIPVDLEDGAGTIDIFVTITGTTPLQEATNDGESSANQALETIPSRLTPEEIEHYKFFSTLRSMNPIVDVGKLEIKIYQARDLSAKDIGGKSDPFCVIELDSTRLRTHTIYKTLDPVWNKSFVIPVQDIHSILQLTIYDEDTNKSNEFIGKVAIPLLTIKNGEKKWMALKDRKCLLPVKGAVEIEATLIYTNLKAVIRTFNPRQVAYYQTDGKFSVGAIKQHVSRIQNMLRHVINVAKFIDYCFQWESPSLSFFAFLSSLVIVWNFELYMIPCTLLLFFARSAIIEYRQGRLGKPFASLGDETIAAVVQPAPVDEEMIEAEANAKETKKSFVGVIQSIQETVLEIQGYVDAVASTLERIKNLFNFTVPWLSILCIIILFFVAVLLYYVPLRYLILAFVINKFTKRFRKPKGYIDNNELADFMSRLPSDPELMQYRELKVFTRIPTPKKNKRTPAPNK